MRRAIGREQREYQKTERFASTIVIAASIIAAVRLAREDISRVTPRINAVVIECVSLAKLILNQIVR